MWDWWNLWGWGGGMIVMMFIGGLMMLLFWGAIIALVVWLVRRPAEGGGYRPGGERRDPLDIARERYARGEITREQFEQIKKDLAG